MMVASVTVKELVDAMDDIRVLSGQDQLDRKIMISDLSRPGLELTGYFNYYPQDRIQLFGRTEISFSSEMISEEKLMVMRRMCHPEMPAFLVSRDLTPPVELLTAAQEHNIPVLVSDRSTTRLSINVTNFLEERLAERKSVHGVLVDIYGMGVLITGESGIGKSETALELIQKGHRLIADDRVELFMMDERRVFGEAPDILKHLMEIRGIGVVDIVNLFGVGAVRTRKTVDMEVHLQLWEKNQDYERFGTDESTTKYFNVALPKISIPVREGRTLSTIIEIAAMNQRAKSMGFDAASTFRHNLAELIKKNSSNES